MLQRSLDKMSIDELRDECAKHGAHDLLLVQSVSRDRSSLRKALLQALLEPWEANDDDEETIQAWLGSAADTWPASEIRPQPDLTVPGVLAAIASGSAPWSATAHARWSCGS